MGQSYIQEMANHKRQVLEDKLRNINEDNIKLKHIQQEGEEERYRQTLSRIQLKRDRNTMLQIKEEQKQLEDKAKDYDKTEYNRMVQQNIQKEISKEIEYKGYFQDYENKHKNRVRQHENYLRNSYNRREGETDLYEKKYIEERQAVGDIIAKNTIEKQNDLARKNFDIVKQQLEKKQMDRMREVEIQRKAIEQRFKDDEYNKQLDKLEKEENSKSKMMYSDFLKRQVDMKKSQNYAAMTDIEVKINRPDITNYSNHRSVQSLIPGINHIDSIGSKPTCRKGINISPVKENIKIDQALTDRTKVVRNNESRSSVRVSISRNNKDKRNQSLPKNNSDFTIPPIQNIENNEILKTISKPLSRTHKRGMTHSMADGLSIHNPITNPMNLYNPYLKNVRNQVINEGNNYRGVFN